MNKYWACPVITLLSLELSIHRSASMSASSQRLSQSLSSSWTAEPAPLNFITAPATDSQEWIKDWKGVLARGEWNVLAITDSDDSIEADLIDTRLVSVDAETSVEDACDVSFASPPDSRLPFDTVS